MKTSERRILTSHVGSLPRPDKLRRFYVMRSRGEAVPQDELAHAVREAVADVVRKQIECGIDIGNDGEQQREAFFLYIRDRLTGFGGAGHRLTRSDIRKYPEFQRLREARLGAKDAILVANNAPPQAIGPVSYIEPGAASECALFRAAVSGASGRFTEAFITAPSPGLIARAMQNAFYDSEDEYLAALTQALRIEYEKIVAAGFLLQIDSPDLGLERARTYRDRPLADFLAFARRSIAAVNAALVNIPADKVRLHICWGNSEGPHDEDVPLEDIIPIVRGAKVGGFVLPFANPRHGHEFRYLPHLLADGQIIVAGVIDTTTNYIEHPEVVADRLERVAATVGGPQRVIAGTDCGFDSAAGLGEVARDVVWAKLSSLVEGARRASARLY